MFSWLQDSSTHVPVCEMPRTMQQVYSLACLNVSQRGRTYSITHETITWCATLCNMAAKKKTNDKPGPWDNINRGLSTFNKVAGEILGQGDIKRFQKNPSLKTAGSLALTIATYASGPALQGAKVSKAAQAAGKVSKTMEARAAAAAANAAKETRVVKAYKGAGALTTKSGSKVPVSGIKTFETGKNPVRAAASTRAVVARQAEQAAKTAAMQVDKKMAVARGAAAALATGKTSSTVTAQNNKKKKK